MFGSKKEKMTLEDFIYHTGSYIINMEKMTYDIYLRNDPNSKLSQENFLYYADIELKFRLSLLDAYLNGKLITRKLRVDNYEYGFALGKGLSMAFRNVGYSADEVSNIMNDLQLDFEGYKDYAIKNETTFPEVMPIINYVFYYFSSIINKNYRDSPDKIYTFGVILKSNEKVIAEYLESTYKSVKIIR